MLKLTFVTEVKISCIKVVRAVMLWDLFTAKNAIEDGVYLQSSQLAQFLKAFDLEWDRTQPIGPKPSFQVVPCLRPHSPVILNEHW